MKLHQVLLAQGQEIPVARIQAKTYSLRYAYARSADSLKNADVGQDHLAFAYDESKIVFALSDGVSQSFYGDLAARFLGERLLTWMTETEFQQNGFESQLQVFFAGIQHEAIAQVADRPLPSNLSPMLVQVLEKKRLGGSECTFVAGVVDFSINKIHLCWAGDSRLRIWNGEVELTSELFSPEEFQTKERWSSQKGVVGKLHTRVLGFQPSWRVAVYSDGFSVLDRLRSRMPSDKAINSLISEAQLEPSSDDISFFEVAGSVGQPSVSREPKVLGDVRVNQAQDTLTAFWKADSAGLSELEVRTQTERRHWFTKKTELAVPISQLPAADHYLVRVRRWENDEPGVWTRPVQIPGAIAVVPAEAQTSPVETSQVKAEVNNTALGRFLTRFRRLDAKWATLSVILGIALSIFCIWLSRLLEAGNGI